MNQISRQKAKNLVEKDFYKLLNNSNFGYDCQNNIDNCSFEPTNDELEEIPYLKSSYINLVFDKEISEFVNCNLIEQEVKEEFNQNLLMLISMSIAIPEKIR